MKILVTGGNGFIGRYLYKILNKNHLVLVPPRSKLNLHSQESLTNFLDNQKNPIDLVIHTAIGDGHEYAHLNENIGMFYNLCKHKHYFKHLINFASGAEFDQKTDINSKNNDLENSFPYDIYGMSKNIISRVLHTTPHFYNLRLYGCFGLEERPNRFIVKNINNYVRNKPIEIYQDKYFDYFNLKDVAKVVEYYVDCFEKNLPLEKDIDLTYSTKLKLSDIANIINNFDKKKSEIKINDSKLGLSYTGKNGIPYDIKLEGLEKGLRQIYNTIKPKPGDAL